MFSILQDSLGIFEHTYVHDQCLLHVAMPIYTKTMSMYSQILWSNEFAEAVIYKRNVKDKTPLQLAVEKGNVK